MRQLPMRRILALALLFAGVGCRNAETEVPPSPVASPPPADDLGPASAVPEGFRLDGRRLINVDAGWSIELPAGWRLSGRAQPTQAIVEREGIEAALTVLALPPTAAVEARETLADSLLAAPVGFRVVEEGERAIGGREAATLRLAATIDGRPMLNEHYVVAGPGATYIFGFELLETDEPQVGPEIEAMMSSLRLASP